MNRRKVDVVVYTFFIVIALVVLVGNNLVEGGAETELDSLLLPRIIAGFILLFSATIAIQSIVKLHKRTPLADTERFATTGFGGIAVYALILVGYWLVLPYVGFLVATPFAMFGIALLLGGRNWITLIAMSIVTPAIIYYASINLLRVFLPTWSLS